jgi:tagaturonate reductase
MNEPILQFGTSRFLQAHVDLFVGEALARGEALGHIVVVQSTGSAQSGRRVAAFNTPGGYTVRIRGRSGNQVIDRAQCVSAVSRALQAEHDWALICELGASSVRVIVSNTGDQGYALCELDTPALLDSAVAPRAFPAKLLVLLHARYRRGAAPITLLPCELVANNGSVLRDIVLALAASWALEASFIAYLRDGCMWLNSLVDRIVSEAIEPVGAVAEPYAIWVIEQQPNMVLPCTHPAIVITGDLAPYERRKLYLLNLGHSYLAEQWLRRGAPAGATVLQAMSDDALRAELEALWEQEVLPVFDALGEADISRAYLAQVCDRFRNPFLGHQLADIATNHEQKKRRRLAPVVALAQHLNLALAQTRLRQALGLGADEQPA